MDEPTLKAIVGVITAIGSLGIGAGIYKLVMVVLKYRSQVRKESSVERAKDIVTLNAIIADLRTERDRFVKEVKSEHAAMVVELKDEHWKDIEQLRSDNHRCDERVAKLTDQVQKLILENAIQAAQINNLEKFMDRAPHGHNPGGG